jgi:hypothetical protein
LLSGQTATSPPQENASQGVGTTLRVETTLVQIPVAVTDSVNRFVLGLQKQDFHLLEDGVEQDIAHFSGEEAPLSVGLAFDESGSMDYPRKWSKLRFSIVTTTMCSIPEFAGSGRLGKSRGTSSANTFLFRGHDAPTNAVPETNAAFFNNSRRFTFMMSLLD